MNLRSNLGTLRASLRRLSQTVPADIADGMGDALRRASPFSMTSPERLNAAFTAGHHAAALDGDLVECGVWRGGCSMAMAFGLMAAGTTDHNIWLYDTFEGMSRPTSRDRKGDGSAALSKWEQSQRGNVNEWCYADEVDVRAQMQSTCYPMEHIRFVKGKVEDTIPGQVPERIAVLRLDTDWYESTHHELEHLWPLLVPGGLLLLDDYGHWQGARDAVDEYLAALDVPVYLARVDYTGRIAVKP